ncbi:MAG: hypothetical protein JNM13_15670 [Hyphomicrobiaceae bacterium]|nr:hypothetical protein [Hyphomicrobiaceae bacterium]
MSYATARQRLPMWPGAGQTSADRVGLIEQGEQVPIIGRAVVMRDGATTEWLQVRRGGRVGWIRAAMVREGD